MTHKKKAMTSEKARYVRRKGHEDAKKFAELMGGEEYKVEPTGKPDVIGPGGIRFSVKSGQKKWQIFLYSKSRFQTDENFTMKLGNLFLECIECFPEKREDYLKDKRKYKLKLIKPMQKICEELQNKNTLRWFLYKSLFDQGVEYLVIKEKERDIFHVFHKSDVIKTLAENFNVVNSKARREGEVDAQKVVFKIKINDKDKTCGEIEMQNDSEVHYREIKFWLDRNLTFELLKSKIGNSEEIKENIIFYGEASSKLKKLFKK